MLFDEMIKQRLIIADGAMGTYFLQKFPEYRENCEKANIYAPEKILSIHREYIDAGAKIIRTNTFSSNTKALNAELPEVLKTVKSGYEIAKKAAQNKACVVCNIGEIAFDGGNEQEVFSEYTQIIDCFFSLGAKNFILESLSSVQYLPKLARYIKENDKTARIMVSFALSPRGRTYSGENIKIISEGIAKNREYFDAVGLNCGCGPVHMVHFINELYERTKHLNIPLSAMPNAGFTDGISKNRNSVYFSEMLSSNDFLDKVKIVGGCCGTTPEHIKFLSDKLKYTQNNAADYVRMINSFNGVDIKKAAKTSSFNQKLKDSRLVIAAELDPPYSNDISKLTEASKRLKESCVDAITISDSPMARARMDSVVCAAKIKREVDIDVLPHICCRDKNINAIKSALLGMNCEEIDTVLAVTGDKVPESDQKYVKPVFNLSSVQLMKLIQTMNRDIFANRPITVGGALNFDCKNEKAFLQLAQKKIQAGLSFFLTQPVFSKESVEKIKKVRALGAKVLVGIMPIISYKNALFMNNEIQGIDIPDVYVKQFSKVSTKAEAVGLGINLACENIEMSRTVADGFYFMTPFNRADIVCEIIDRSRGILNG